jgi:hypothetical protein
VRDLALSAVLHQSEVQLPDVGLVRCGDRADLEQVDRAVVDHDALGQVGRLGVDLLEHRHSVLPLDSLAYHMLRDLVVEWNPDKCDVKQDRSIPLSK